ncbi:MAG: hypothetical protein LUD29_02690, partial [Clostridia bacterium]|nr:hypothetical protein [Clostridia bacterium]
LNIFSAVLVACLAFVFVFFSACGLFDSDDDDDKEESGGTGSASGATYGEVEGVTLSETAITLCVGERMNLLAVVSVTEGEYDGNYYWCSSDTDVVYFSSTTYGPEVEIKAAADGISKITVSAGGVSAECEVVVETPIDGRITLNAGYTELGGENFANPDGLRVATALTEDGVYTYTLSGVAALMTESEADAFWSGVAKAGDAYVVIEIELLEGETASWTASDGKTKSVAYEETENGSFDVVIRISGDSLGEDKKAGYTEYTITRAGGEETRHVVYFGDLAIPAIALAGEVEGWGATFSNSANLAMSVSVGEDGSFEYILSGTASEMTEAQANAFWTGEAAVASDVAKAGDKYVVVEIYLHEGESVTWTATDGQQKSVSYDELSGDVLDVVIRLTGVDAEGQEISVVSNVYDIGGVSHTLYFSGVAV